MYAFSGHVFPFSSFPSPCFPCTIAIATPYPPVSRCTTTTRIAETSSTVPFQGRSSGRRRCRRKVSFWRRGFGGRWGCSCGFVAWNWYREVLHVVGSEVFSAWRIGRRRIQCRQCAGQAVLGMQRNSSRAEGVLRGLQFLTSKHLLLPSLIDVDDIALVENVSYSTQRLQLSHHRSRFTV